MATELAKAYVQIMPSAQGISGKLSQIMDGEADSAGKSSGSKFSSAFGGILKGAGVMAATAVGAVAVGITSLTKAAVGSYSEYEQLAGGTELLFGRTAKETEALRQSMLDSGMSARQVADEIANMSDASDTVMQNAKTAFSRVQMSMNDYLQTANGYATGLKESLGGDAAAAAELTDKIITAQADVVAATGQDAELVANAFAGVMKNNFNMLDNLGLGINANQEGMQEVIDKMNELNGTKYEMGNLADMQSALVDYIEYVGMAGYAHDEAAKTIQGSLASTKAAWENVITAIAGGGDFEGAIDGLITSLFGEKEGEGFITQLLPIIQTTMEGIGQLIVKLSPIIGEQIPILINNLLPSVTTAISSLISSLTSALPGLLQSLLAVLPGLLNTVVQAILDNLPMIIEVGMQMIMALVNGIAESLPTLIPEIVNIVVTIVQTLIDNIPMLVEAAIQLISGLVEGILSAIPQLIAAIPDLITSLIDAIVQGLPLIIEGAIQLVLGIVEHLPEIIQALIDAIPQIIEAFVQGLITGIPQLIAGLVTLTIELVKHLPEIIMALIEAIPEIIMAICEAFGPIIDGLCEVFSAAWEGIKNVFSAVGSWFSEKWTEAKEAAQAAWEGIEGFFSTVWEGIKGVFSDTTSWFGERFAEAKEAAQSAWENTSGFFSDVWDSITDVFSNVGSWFLDIGKNMVEGIRNGFANAWEGVKNFFTSKVTGLVDSVKGALNIGSPSKVFADEVGQWIPAGIAEGIDRGMGALNKQIKAMTDDALVGTITASTEAINSVNYVPNVTAASDNRPIVINNEITVNGAEDPEAWTQTFIRTLKREARMA